MEALEKLRELLPEEQFEKIKAIDNPELHSFLAEWIEWLEPSKVFVCTDSEEDELYVRWKALYYGEEKMLETPNLSLIHI